VRALVLMGSGETSPTMVKTHRSLLSRSAPAPRPVVLDTPFGFQSNADELTARARRYFADSVGCALGVVSYRSAAALGSAAYETAMSTLRAASYVFAGPGSPTYALRTWRPSLVPSLLEDKLRAGGPGGVVTFASAAALTLGVVTVPVYEIYKVGEDPAWVGGLNLLEAATGLCAAVIPHFDNVEGGTHDTRYCYLGEERLSLLEASLPEGAFVLGVDEHTGLVLDLDAGSAEVVGNGGVTVRTPGGSSRVLPSGTTAPIESLRPDAAPTAAPPPATAEPAAPPENPLLAATHDREAAFDEAMAARDAGAAAQAVLDAEAEVQAWANETFSSDEYDRARALLRGMVVRLGDAAQAGVADPREALGPFVDLLVDLRRAAKDAGRYDEADAIRDRLADLGVELRDTRSGVEWHLLR
jgi:hypothetical protein